jgi:mono/diheme cytochrome c family protein
MKKDGSEMKSSMIKTAGLVIFLIVSLNACGYLKHAEPYYSYAPDMHYSPGLKAQKIGSMRPLVTGTIPRGFRPYSLTTMDQAKLHLNPLPRDRENLLQGKILFNTFCIVCHGKFGEGDGLVASLKDWPRPLFPRPPSLQSEKIRDYKDGQIFHVITMGQNLMPSYAEKLNEEERWQVVHYLRVLYRAKHPSADDLKKAESYIED